ncbi:HNH endonuclease [Pseudonocardia phyllosphaerae]|uniref:HNH endonuclease n=1 Tax=Pseudonocardia phyllosphaerae TaxID=3390502 RepID=UPI00397BF25B
MPYRQPVPGGAEKRSPALTSVEDCGPAPGSATTVPTTSAPTTTPAQVPHGSRVLLLNASFEPLAVVTSKRAICLLLSGKAECLQEALEGSAFHSENLELPAPSVLRLSRYVRVPYRRAVPMTRAGVLRRDGRRCAYCSRRADTIDHVIPRSRGGQHSWENCVAACRACNSKKADRLIEEIGWTLPKKPGPPARNGAGVLVLAVEPLPAWEPWLAAA